MNWRRFLHRAQADREQQEELESYIEITTQEYIARGMAPAEAALAARRKLGNLTRIREEVYEMNTATFLEGTLEELRHAGRMLCLNPAFSITAILTLALGMGATTAMFSVVNGVVINPLPYPESEDLVTVTHSAVFGNVRTRNFPFSPQMFAVYAAGSQAFEDLAMWRPGHVAITGQGDPEQAVAVMATQGFLPAFGVQPALGRWFSRDDDQPGSAETVILSSGYWQRRLGSDPQVIGRSITIDSNPHTVIGVMPASFNIGGSTPIDLILPVRINLAQPPGDFSYRAFGRLKKGATVAQANADIGRMLPVFLERYAGHRMDSLHLQPAVRPFKEDVVGDTGEILWVLLGSISILLLIACANVANLLLVRSEGRGQELAIRTALGAGWGHIARALTVESLTISVLGGLVGLGLAYGGLRALVAYGPANLPRLGEIAIDPAVLVFTAVMSIASGLLFGLLPILKVVRSKSAWSISDFVRGGGRWASSGKRQHRSQDVLVVVQVALALVLLVGSGLMIRTFQNLRKVQPGFTRPEAIQTMRISMPDSMGKDAERVARMQREVLERVAGIPGVKSAAYTDQLPTEDGIGAIVAPEGKTYGSGELPPVRRVKFMSPGLLRTLGTPLRAGRDFDWAEVSSQHNVALVSESFARETWSSVAGAIGKRIRIGTIGPFQEVIGVVADVYDDGPDKNAPASVYWPVREHPFVASNYFPLSVAFAIRSDRTGTESFLRDIRQAVSGAAPDLPIVLIRTMTEVYAASMARTSFSLVLLGIAGGMALLLGIVGIYGVLAYAVMQRQREVGIRLALGAQPRAVERMFVYRGMILSSIGIGLGVVAAAGITRWMASLLFGVKPVDAATFAAAAGVLVVAALAASYVPARRAAAVDPVETLRGQ